MAVNCPLVKVGQEFAATGYETDTNAGRTGKLAPMAVVREGGGGATLTL